MIDNLFWRYFPIYTVTVFPTDKIFDAEEKNDKRRTHKLSAFWIVAFVSRDATDPLIKG